MKLYYVETFNRVSSDLAKNKIAYTKYSENRKMCELHCRSLEHNMCIRLVKKCYNAATTIYSEFDDLLIMNMLSFCNLVNVLILLIDVNIPLLFKHRYFYG